MALGELGVSLFLLSVCLLVSCSSSECLFDYQYIHNMIFMLIVQSTISVKIIPNTTHVISPSDIPTHTSDIPN